jgi:enterochelin esterase-like enzyme
MPNLLRRRLLAALPAACLVACAGQTKPMAIASTSAPSKAGGRYVSYANFPARAVAPRQVRIWLPADYDTSTQRYAVLYMHDGQNLFEPADAIAWGPWDVDNALARLMREGKARPTIVVGIWNSGANRAREYGPAAPLDALPENLRAIVPGASADALRTPLSDQYLRFLVGELKPFIDANYRTLGDRANTTVMGSSMGGLISLYALASYPQVFGAAGCLSTHWPITTDFKLLQPTLDPRVATIADSYRSWLEQHLPHAGTHRLYFDHGSEGLDALYAPYQEKIDALVASKGYRENVDVLSRVFPGEAHNEAAWRKRLALPLEFLLRSQA